MPFGPLAIRPLLRHIRQGDEELVGWAIGHERLTASAAFFRIALALLPGIGHLLVAVSGLGGGPPRRLLILTDRRLLVFATKRNEIPAMPAVAWNAARTEVAVRRGAVIAEMDVGRLTVKVSGLGTAYTMRAGSAPPVSLTIDPRQSRPAARLCQALGMMAPASGDGDEAKAESAARPREATQPILTRPSRMEEIHMTGRGARAGPSALG